MNPDVVWESSFFEGRIPHAGVEPAVPDRLSCRGGEHEGTEIAIHFRRQVCSETLLEEGWKHHHSLLVTANEDIVGVLRLVDVFAAVCQTMKEAFED